MYGGLLRFHDLENQVFKNNLILIDSALPFILAEIVKMFFITKLNSLKDIVENIAQTRNNISGEMSKSQLHKFLEQNKSYKLYNVLGQLQSGNHIENGQYILTDGINFRNLFISR